MWPYSFFGYGRLLLSIQVVLFTSKNNSHLTIPLSGGCSFWSFLRRVWGRVVFMYFLLRLALSILYDARHINYDLVVSG